MIDLPGVNVPVFSGFADDCFRHAAPKPARKVGEVATLRQKAVKELDAEGPQQPERADPSLVTQ